MGFQTLKLKEEEKKEKVHPIWKTIGCVMIILIPIIAFTGALLFIEYNATARWIVWPADFAAPGADRFLYIKIGVTFVFSLVLYFFFVVITFVANALLGPKRYGPQDVPQQLYRGKDYKR